MITEHRQAVGSDDGDLRRLPAKPSRWPWSLDADLHISSPPSRCRHMAASHVRCAACRGMVGADADAPTRAGVIVVLVNVHGTRSQETRRRVSTRIFSFPAHNSSRQSIGIDLNIRSLFLPLLLLDIRILIANHERCSQSRPSVSFVLGCAIVPPLSYIHSFVNPTQNK